MKTLNFKVLFVFTLLFINVELNNLHQGKSNTVIKKVKYNPKGALKKKTNDEIVRKALIIENINSAFLTEKELKEEEEKSKQSLRKLADTQEFKDIGFIHIPQSDISKLTNVYKFILSNLKRYKSELILYPYKFNYQSGSENVNVDNGGVFSLNQTEFDKADFSYIKNIPSVNLLQAKALYDINIAVLSIEYKTEDDLNVDLFYETDHYCALFVQKLRKVTSCLRSIEEFKQFQTNYTSRGAVVLFNETELLKPGSLYENNINKFDLLIVPDHLMGTHEIINSKLTNDGINIIKQFVSNGGQILASGKSGYLLEKWEIIENDTYENTNKYLTAINSENQIKVKGCENTEIIEVENDFIHKVLCLGAQEYSFIQNAYLMKNIDSFRTLLSVDIQNSEGLKYKTDDGIESNLNGDEADFPFVLTKTIGKSRIWIVNGQALTNSDYASFIMNILFNTMSKNTIVNYYINIGSGDEKLPVPGGEEGVQLTTHFDFYNLFLYNVTEFEIDILVPNNVTIKTKGIDECSIKHQNYEETIPLMKTNHYLHCEKDAIYRFDKLKIEFTIEIESAEVTNKKTGIPLMYPILKYRDANELIRIETGYLLIQAELAAVLRATYNVDPSAYYPVPGTGWYTDNVLNVENKEGTEALDVNFISIVPLISPVVDGVDERVVSKYIEVYDHYYDSHNYVFPFITTGLDYDFIDFNELSGKNVVSVIDWDTPVRVSKVLRSEAAENETAHNILHNTTNIDMDVVGASLLQGKYSQLILKELYFGDSDLFYEHATQRQLIFVDVAHEAGAKAQYGDDLSKCKTGKDQHRNGCCKYDFSFTRHDIYFYDSQEFQLPTGMNSSVLLTLDKYPKPEKNLSDSLGKSQSYIVKPGHFNTSKTPKLVSNEYSNELLQNTAFKVFNLSESAFRNELSTVSEGNIKLTHYIVPVMDEDLKFADSIRNFQLYENSDRKGYNTLYPDLKFIDGHTIKIRLLPEITRAGGRVTIIFSGNYTFDSDPIEKEYITTSADNVAFYKTEYKYENAENKITLYFRRGLLPNEAYGKPSLCEVYLENLIHFGNKSSVIDVDFNVTIKLEQLKYNLNSPSTQYEEYNEEIYNDTINKENYINASKAFYGYYWSLPALYMENKLTRGKDDSHRLREYEFMTPYARYGVYMQELMIHGTIWGQLEAHHVTDPGLQTINGGFALISAVGISFIPFAEYVTHGTGLLIPGAVSTTRIEWTDIWGRRWIQPIRSLYPDIPPVPAPLMNFMMSTTFELFTKDGKERLLEWPSDEEGVIRVQMKFKNNYLRWFQSTVCLENQYPYEMTKIAHFDRDRYYFNEYIDGKLTPTYSEDDQFIVADNVNDKNHQVSLGQGSVYGVCYKEGSCLSGRVVTASDAEHMHEAMVCADTNDPNKIAECVNTLKALNLPLLKMRPSENAESDEKCPTYNFSPQVNNYYPEGYIDDDRMWDLTMPTYEDNAFSKAYVWHLDNNLPAIDVCPPQNPAYYKPHNFATFPIFKGFGYQIEYDKNFSFEKRFPGYKGWWTDNLQNKDFSLLAGQAKNNKISVDKPELLTSDDWISASELLNTRDPEKNVIKKRLKNIYVCLFNQHRVRVSPYQTKYSYPNNVYQNNVVPVIPDLESDDERLTNFDCEGKYQYSPKNISQVDNRVYTATDKDWLYFALNLRGEALENINILLTIKPFEDRKYEGTTKVQEGGRFTYWNPPNGPNSFLVVDNVANLINSYRVDYEITSNTYPNTLNTFNLVSYQLHEIDDKEENLREYKLSIYDNSYGFGDSTVLVYVGGTFDTSCKVIAGETTYVKVIFYNNAGFDWHMLGNAIEFESTGTNKVVSGYELMQNIIRNIKVPIKYNFIKLTIPDEIKNYIDIVPSDHNADAAPMFFDFQTINVVTIRDGFEGSYFYKLTVHDDFPDIYKGKLWSIKAEVVEKYFDQLPGYNDPTGSFHDYKLQIPDIKFGVPYSNGIYQGKIFYTLGRGTNLELQYKIMKNFKVDGIKLISEEDVVKLGNVVTKSKQSEKDDEALKIWENAASPKNGVFPYTISNYDDQYNYLTIDLSKVVTELPYENIGLPDTTKINVLTKLSANQLEYGGQYVVKDSFINYSDGRKNKKNVDWSWKWVRVNGPWLDLSAPYYIVVKNEETGLYEQSTDQDLYENDIGILYVNLTAKNRGNDNAYDIEFKLYVPNDITLDLEQLNKYNIESSIIEDRDENILTIKTHRNLGGQESYLQPLYIGFGNVTLLNQKRGLEEKKRNKTIIRRVEAKMCPSSKCTVESYVTQKLDFSIKEKVKEGSRGTVELNVETLGNFLEPKYKLEATPSDDKNVKYYNFYKKINDNDWEKIVEKSNEKTLEDSPLNISDTEGLDKYSVSYRVETINNENRIIAGDGVLIEESKASENKVKKKYWIYIILIIVASLLFVAVVAWIILAFLKRREEKEKKPKRTIVNERHYNNGSDKPKNNVVSRFRSGESPYPSSRPMMMGERNKNLGA